MLGQQPDRKIAELTGRTVKNVRHKRLKLGIPFFNPEFRPWKPEELELLGKIPDEEIALITKRPRDTLNKTTLSNGAIKIIV